MADGSQVDEYKIKKEVDYFQMENYQFEIQPQWLKGLQQTLSVAYGEALQKHEAEFQRGFVDGFVETFPGADNDDELVEVMTNKATWDFRDAYRELAAKTVMMLNLGVGVDNVAQVTGLSESDIRPIVELANYMQLQKLCEMTDGFNISEMAGLLYQLENELSKSKAEVTNKDE